jgi:hypothetical protein
MGVEKPAALWSAAAALGMDLEGVPFWYRSLMLPSCDRIGGMGSTGRRRAGVESIVTARAAIVRPPNAAAGCTPEELRPISGNEPLPMGEER